MNYVVGIDFGTTNTALTARFDDGNVQIATFSARGAANICRTALFFPEPETPRRNPPSSAGDQALADCIDAQGEGRFIQSLKSFLASQSFGATQIFGARFTLPSLLLRFTQFLRQTLVTQFGGLPRLAVVGTPVNFAYAKNDDDNALARDRLREAFALVDIPVQFAAEPVAAAYTYRELMTKPSTVMVADFGGGTSDFALVQLPMVGDDAQPLVLGTSGVAVAGDDFDAKIVRHVVAPSLGRGSFYQSFGGDEREVPATFFHKLETWHHLSFMNNPTVLKKLRTLKRDAFAPELIAKLIWVIEENLGFHLHAAVGQTKRALSSSSHAQFRFALGDETIEANVERAAFETWIQRDVTAIGGAVSTLFEQTGTQSNDVDAVFMTGGTSFVPAVRAMLETYFDTDKLQSGGELVSICHGLSAIAAASD